MSQLLDLKIAIDSVDRGEFATDKMAHAFFMKHGV